MIIYKITNRVNGKTYIGQTRYSLAHRWAQHCRTDSNCSALSAAINKYGRDAFTKVVIAEYKPGDDLNAAEMYFIEFHNCIAPNGYNITAGGEAATHSEESKLKLSEAKLGDKNPMWGKKQSEETKAKRSAALKGRKRPQWVKDKIRASHNPKSDLNLTYRRKPTAHK